jgi:hypothetical protein
VIRRLTARRAAPAAGRPRPAWPAGARRRAAVAPTSRRRSAAPISRRRSAAVISRRRSAAVVSRRRSPAALVPCRRSRLIAGALVAAAVLLALAFAAPARAGTFRVSQCGAADGGAAGPRGHQAGLWTVAGGWLTVECGMPGGRLRVDTNYHRLSHTEAVTARFELPATMPGTALRTAWLDWTSLPQAPSDNPAFLFVQSGGALVREARTGDGTPPGAAGRFELPRGARDLRFHTWCSWANGPGWCVWPGALFELRAMTLELEEGGEPAASVAGPLLAPREHAGVEPLEVVASDGDSGVRRVEVALGGTPAGAIEPPLGCRDDRLPPCPQTLRGTVDVDTRVVADGTHRLRVTVTDAAGNARTLDPGTVSVRNRRDGPPIATEPAGAPSPAAPSTAPPAPSPARAFPPNPLAGRGHVRNGSHASERARIRAWLEPGGGERTRRVTVPPGVRVRIRGSLTDPRGRPIGRATLAAVRREPGGEWKPVTGVRTRPNGRFTAFTRIGPSQELRFVYYAYGDSTTGRSSPALRVSVMPR